MPKEKMRKEVKWDEGTLFFAFLWDLTIADARDSQSGFPAHSTVLWFWKCVNFQQQKFLHSLSLSSANVCEPEGFCSF